LKDLATLVGKQISLRPFQASDAPVYSQWLGNPQFRFLVGEKEMSIAEVLRVQTAWTEASDIMEYIIVENKSDYPIGDISIRLVADRNRVNRPTVGIMIGNARYRKNKIGRDAMQLLLPYARKFFPGPMYAEIFPYNKDSQIFFDKFGFENNGMIMDTQNRECYLYILR
jgi:RimJ/RimL family protein N-acetyltransferase